MLAVKSIMKNYQMISIRERDTSVTINALPCRQRLEYIYIKTSTDRSVSFYQNTSVWLDIVASRSWDRNPVDSKANPRLYPLSHE